MPFTGRHKELYLLSLSRKDKVLDYSIHVYPKGEDTERNCNENQWLEVRKC